MGCRIFKARKVSPIQGTSSESTDVTLANSRKRARPMPPTKIDSSSNTGESCQRTSWPPVTSETAIPTTKTGFTIKSDSFPQKFINVLFLGESGVGKSTFINALVNYLAFDTLEQARSRQPIALMPVSFLMTVGNNFEEKIVRFGGKDPNEDHNQSGQSVTQHCRSYVFTIGTETKIRLIDTPGMGDSRGLDQDDRNMQHILSYINRLPHLNAICILLKPNEATLNVVSRSYFTQLLGFLGENVRNNVIFCFTNTRGTFFSPGDTAPLVRQMLNDIPIKRIPFDKSNTFCFDSESFRYLIALKNGIEFDDDQKKEYTQSWVTSVNESNRFLRYICSELKSYPQANWQSIEHAQFQITQLTRPMLETIRNTLRNIILITEDPTKPQIELHLTAALQSSTICRKCKRIPQECGGFMILPDELHSYLEECTRCKCDRKKHIDVDYKLDYNLSNDANKQSINILDQNLDQLKQVTVEFGYFFLCTTQSSKVDDPIMSFLNDMIEEEDQIRQEKGSEHLNSKLHKKLNQYKDEYEHKRSVLMSNKKPINLTRVYEQIRTVNDMDFIRKQTNVISL